MKYCATIVSHIFKDLETWVQYSIKWKNNKKLVHLYCIITVRLKKSVYREQTHGCQWGADSEGGMEWEFAVSRCKLLYIEWINNKVLLYSTGSYIQYSVINPDGKECEKECRWDEEADGREVLKGGDICIPMGDSC